jgi:hypothetical protein
MADFTGSTTAAVATTGRSHSRQNRFNAAEDFIIGPIRHRFRDIVHRLGCKGGEESAHLILHLGAFCERRNELSFYVLPEALPHSA